jgi:CrcB protein
MKIVAISYVVVGAGGAFGAMARYALNIALQRGVNFPWGTLSANLLGCLIMGVLAQLVASSDWFNNAGIIPDHYRLMFAVGFCGSFTTLSALVLELHTMLQRNEIFASFLYVMASVIGGFAFFLAGFMLLRMLREVA